MEQITVVLAEDHVLVREGTRHVLENQPGLVVVGEAGDGEEALALVEKLHPDVLIIDICMPHLSGIDAVRRIGERSAHTKTLVLTAYDDDEYIVAAMEAGATGYLLKTARSGELVDAVRAVHAGEPFLHPAIAAKVVHLWRRRHDSSEATNKLSHRELEVLQLAARGMRNKAIADTLMISVRTVEGHLTSILSKLGVGSRVAAVIHAVAQGWVTVESGSR